MTKRELMVQNRKLAKVVKTLTAENQRLNDLVSKIAAPKKSKKQTSFDIKSIAEKSHKYAKKYFTNIIHYEDGNEIVSDGRFMIVNKAEYPASYEGRDFDFVKNELVENTFPNWKRVVPDDSKLEECDFVDLKQIPVIRKLSKAKEWKNLYRLEVSFYSKDLNNRAIFSMAAIDVINEICKYSTNCKAYIMPDCFNNGCYYRPLIIKADERFCVVMPMTSENSADYFAEVKNGKIFLQNKKITINQYFRLLISE